MIRINLLPIRQAKKREYGRQQLILFFVLIVLECAVLFMFYGSKKAEVDDLTETVAELRREAAELTELQSEISRLDGQIRRVTRERNRVRTLMQSRIGPAAALDDLKFILNPPSNEAEETEQVNRRFANNVDPREIWVGSITIDRRRFSMSGVALSHGSMAEFIHRLETAPRDLPGFFVRPNLSNYRTERDAFFGTVKRFEISGGVRNAQMAP